MTEYHDIEPDQAFSALDELATEYFGTDRWKTKFAQHYGLTVQALNLWMNKDQVPLWAIIALTDALDARRFAAIKEAVTDRMKEEPF